MRKKCFRNFIHHQTWSTYCTSNCAEAFGADDVKNDVIRSKDRSNIEMAVTSLMCELDHRSKAQNVGNTLGYLDNITNFRWHFSWKSSSRSENFVTFPIFSILNIAQIWHHRWKDHIKIMHRNVFHVDDVTSDVTALRQNQSSIFIFKMKLTHFHT